MNDAAEFETSLTGAIDFFQNLRRKLGTLDAETGVQHDQLQGLAASVTAIRQDQQQLEQTLAALTGHLQTQGDALRQELQSALEQRAPAEQIAGLEAQLARHAQGLRQLQETLQGLAQDAPQLRDQVETLAARVEELEPLIPVVEAGQAQWLQLQQDVAGLKDEVETQRQNLTDAGQIQQHLQRQQERLKHVETFMGKVAADTNSTRQILNVLQSDLTTQSDTLREFDQFWRDSFAAYPDRPASPAPPVAAMLEETGAPESTASAIVHEALDDLTAALAATRQEHADIQQELAAVQAAISDQGERLAGQDAGFAALRNALWEQLQNQQDHLGELASALNLLRQAPVSTGVDELVADLTALRETLTPRIETIDELQQSAQRQIQNQWDQISELEIAIADLRQAAVPATGTHEGDADLTALRETLTLRIEALDEAQQALRQQLQTQQDQFGPLETALNDLRQAPAPGNETELFNAELATLHHALAEQNAALNHLQRAADQRFAELSAALETQRLAEMQRELIQPAPFAAGSPPADEIQQNLAELQESIDALENRLVSQAQAFSGNFEQFRGLRTDIQAVQNHIAQLESTPQQLTALEQNLADQEQDVAQLKDALQQIQTDAQQLFEATLQQGGVPQVIDLEARLVGQSEQLNALNAILETVCADAKATQDKVVTMASNVAKRMHEFQNQMTAIETTQGERLQELEQKIIWLQAALETAENQRKSRRWFSMPASLTMVVLTVGATLLAITH